jgi:hypothetical protein
MKWRKLGLIFDLAKNRLPKNCIGFAQSPQAVVFEDFIRVYFSTRATDPKNGKFISEVVFTDLKPDLSEVIRVSDRPVIERGLLGCFDEHGIFPMNVIKRGAELWAYTCGWSRRVSVQVETGIGLAVSKDGGLNFVRVGNGPVLTSSPKEPYLVGDGFVLQDGDSYHMWYIFGTNWRSNKKGGVPERTYKIGHAVSEDAIVWRKTEEGSAIIPDVLGNEESQALPCVIKIEDVYHMFFCFRESFDFRSDPARAYRLGHAFSRDLKNWMRDDRAIPLKDSHGSWDSDMRCYPNVFKSRGKTYLLYNGNEFGRHGFGAAVLEK